MVDWILSFIAQHSMNAFWMDASTTPIAFRDILFYNIIECIHARLV